MCYSGSWDVHALDTTYECIDGPHPRLCIIRTWSDFKGYGFNLQAEQGRTGHFIGRVDAGSPAEVAGLRGGDHVIEVNNSNVQSETHSQVVSRIREQPDVVRLLAIEPEGEEHYKSRGITITSHMSNVIVGDSEERNVRSSVVAVLATPEAEEISQHEPELEPERKPEVNAIGENTIHCSATNISYVLQEERGLH